MTTTLVERLRTFNQDREPQLVQRKYQAMHTDPFAFFRGTCHLFYQDWQASTVLDQAPPVWLCGDLHWQNFGSYRGNNRQIYFDVNDFDEAILGPCTWDLARLLVSILLSASLWHISEEQALDLTRVFLASYGKAVEKGQMRVIDVEKTSNVVHDLFSQIQTRNQDELLTKYTTQSGTIRKFNIDDKRLLSVPKAKQTAIHAVIKPWAERQASPNHFTLLDIAQRIAGVGSLGVERYLLLVSGKGSPDHNYLLDLKAETPSSLEPYINIHQPKWSSQAERAVAVRRWVQIVPPALLTTISMEDKSYILRELQPEEDKANPDHLKGKLKYIEQYMQTLARVVACGQIHSGGHHGATDTSELIKYLSANHWQKELIQHAISYRDRVKKDFQVFCAAYDNGMLAQ